VPEVLTVLRIDIGPDHPDVARLRRVAGEAGATVVANGDAAVVAAFPFASDAANAVLRLAGAAGGGSGVPRMWLSTGEAVARDGEVSGPARDRVDALAAVAGDAAVLMTASTAVMVHHTLPPGAELVDRGVVAVGPQGSERVYELRTAPGVRGPDDDAAASNLGWARRAATVMVGREEHVARLEAAWAAALVGERRVVVLAGDPGIGKTTVAAELALRVHAGGGIVLYGRWDEEGLAPYQALREALGTYAAACPRSLLRADLSVRADEVARLLPEIAAHIGGVRPPLAEDPEAERLRLFDAVRDWLGAIAARRPLLLVLDDLQWADRSSLMLLRHILDAPPADPLLVVLTRRDGDAEGLGPLHALGSLAGVDIERVEVAGLDPAAVTELVVRALGRPVDDDEAAVSGWLAAETAGNPLYVHEILAGLDPDDPAAALAQVREQLPARVHDVVHWRLSRLAPGVSDVLGAASLIGEEFPLDVLAAVVDVRPLDLRNQLDDATRAGVVRDVGERRVAFAHAVVRRALQDELDPDRATLLHRRIGETLAERNHGGEGAPAAEIAHHLLVSADAATAGRAVRWARAAADHARRETAFENAVWFLTRAIDVLDRFPADGDVELTGDTACEVRLEAAEAHDRAGEFAARDRRHLEAADLAGKLGRADLFVRAALGYGGRLPALPPPNPTARALLEQARLLLPPRDSRALALTLARLAQVIYADSGHDERLALAAEAEAMARRLDAPVVLASVLCSRMLAVDGPDDVEDHLEMGAEVIRIGEQTGDADVVLQGARARVHALFTVGAHDAARDLAERFAGLADTVRHPDHLRLATMWQVMWAILEGRFAAGEAEADELRQRLERAGHPQVLTIYFAEVFVSLYLQGRLPEILPVLDAGIQLDPGALDTWAVRTWALAGVGDVAAAEESLRVHPVEDLATFDRSYTWLVAVVGATFGAVAAGDTAWAAAAHAALLPYSGRNCVLGHAAFLGAVDHHVGVLDLVLGRHDDAVEHLGRALERHRVIGAGPWVALSGAWLANALSERDGRGDAARAAELDAESRELAASLGVAALPPRHAALSG
jgi:hypothetical protein